jgi:hypothetical protein
MTDGIKIADERDVSNFFINIHTDTKLEEREIIEQFLQRLQYSDYVLNEQERPDFKASIDTKSIGIEITKYYSDFSKKGSKMQKNLIEWKNFALSLKQKIETTNNELSNIYGAVHFKDVKFDFKILLSNDYYDELIRSIKQSNALNQTNISFPISETEYPFLSKYINQVYLENKTDTKDFLWWDARLQSGDIINDENAVTNIISKKEKASAGYNNDFDQKWLIIFAAGLGLADIYSEYDNDSKRQGSVFVMSFENEEYKPKSFSTKSEYFTHIYIWDKFHEKIFQVAPYHKKIFDYGQKTIWVNHLPVKQTEI